MYVELEEQPIVGVWLRLCINFPGCRAAPGPWTLGVHSQTEQTPPASGCTAFACWGVAFCWIQKIVGERSASASLPGQ